MVVRPSDPIALTVSGGLPSDEMHVTLGYYGDQADIDSQVLEALQAWAEANANVNIDATVGGVGRIGQDDPPATVMLLEAQGLADLRAQLEEIALPDQTHPHFTPHVTLGYGIDMPEMSDLPEYVNLNRVELWVGDQRGLAGGITAATSSVGPPSPYLQARTALGMSRKQFAAAVGVSQFQLDKIERGVTAITDDLHARFMGVSGYERVFTGAHAPTATRSRAAASAKPATTPVVQGDVIGSCVCQAGGGSPPQAPSTLSEQSPWTKSEDLLYHQDERMFGAPVREGHSTLETRYGARRTNNPFGRTTDPRHVSDQPGHYYSGWAPRKLPTGEYMRMSAQSEYITTAGEGSAWKLNGALRKGKMTAYQREAVDQLDDAFASAARNGDVLPSDSVVMRGVSSRGTADWRPGATWVDDGYSSAANPGILNPDALHIDDVVAAFANDGTVKNVQLRMAGEAQLESHGLVMRIRMADDTPVLSGESALNEVILPRGGTYRVTSDVSPPFTDANGVRWPATIDVDYIPPARHAAITAATDEPIEPIEPTEPPPPGSGDSGPNLHRFYDDGDDIAEMQRKTAKTKEND
jgi:hypothetical protein